MLRSASEWIPLWLNEGLAEFYQNTDIQEKEVLLGQPSQDDILYLRQNRLLPITTLLKVDQTSPYYHEEQKGSVFYAESWALTHYIEVTDRQKGTDRLHDYAKRLINKEDPVVAAQEVFGDLNVLQKALNNYISRGQFMMFKMNAGISVDESGFQARAISNSDADAIRANVLVYNQRPKDAQTLIDAVLHDDPKNALAHESMGYLRFREGDMEAARKWYGEAVQLDSQSYLAHYYYAMMSMKSDGMGQNGEIDSSLRACIKLNPAFAPAYDALAMRYSMDIAKADEAHFLNVQAINLEPDNVNYRINAASVLANGHRYDDAVNVLKVAIHVAKTPEQVAFVQSRIDQIEQYQAAVAKSRQTPGNSDSQSLDGDDTDTRTVTVTTNDGRKYVIKSNGAEGPKYPTEAPTGPRHTIRGILRNVQCSYPTTITLNIEPGGKAPAVAVYRNNFSQIVFSVLNFTPKNDLNPCTDIEGFKAKVDYAEVSDKSIAGQIIAIELSK
jgi:tetratricopeptide (TPR) repeat protein